MAHIEFKDIAAYIGLFIAVFSLCFNFYLAYLVRNKRSRLVRLDELRGALFTMACRKVRNYEPAFRNMAIPILGSHIWDSSRNA
jgi:hypothetical protein